MGKSRKRLKCAVSMLTASAMVLSAGVPAVQATEINNSGINDYGYETYELWANIVIRAIDDIPPVDQLTLDDEATVVKARNLYDEIETDEEKSVVTNYNKLLKAEARMQELKAEEEQHKADVKAAEAVMNSIVWLPEPEQVDFVNLDYVTGRVNTIQASYDALTENQKKLVTNYERLHVLHKVVADVKAAKEVVEKIKKVGIVYEKNYEEKEPWVIEARTAYDQLTDDQKAYVTNYGILEKGEFFLSTVDKDKELSHVLLFINDLNVVSDFLVDGPLEKTKKNNGVPTEEIWKDWKGYVADARALYEELSDLSKEDVNNLSDLETAEGYLYQLREEALKPQLEALPDASTVKGNEETQPTAPDAEVQAAEPTAEDAFSDGAFSDGSEDVFNTEEESADVTEEVQAADAGTEETDGFSAGTEEADVQDEEVRELTDQELNDIIAAKIAFEKMTPAEEERFRSENPALVENLEKLSAQALTYPKAMESYQQQYAKEAGQYYEKIKETPVGRDTYGEAKLFMYRYDKYYAGYAEVMAGINVKVNGELMAYADVIAEIKAQTDKTRKDLDDADQADQWITSLPTAVTKDNIRQVEKELASLKEFMNGMSEEARSYMWKTKELQTLQVIVADCRTELSAKREEFTASCPTDLKTKVLNYKTIQISWNTMDYADSYNVYRKTGTGEWTQIASEVTGVSYKDTTAVTGTKYYYTVCGVSGLWYDTVLSKYNEKGVYGKANLDVPVLSSAVCAGYNSVRLTWGKVSGANGYRIYRSTSKDGQYTCIGAAKKGSLLTFTDKKAIIGTNYYYVVRAYRMVDDSMVKSSASNTLRAKAVMTAPALKVSSSSNAAVLTWTKVRGAQGYQICRSTSENGTYTRIRTLENATSYKNARLSKGKTYYYKVRAYRVVNGKKVYGTYSAVKSVKVQ